MNKKETLLNYYRSIRRGNRELLYNWNDIFDLGLEDPREVLALNNELIRDGILRRVPCGHQSYGDCSLYFVDADRELADMYERNGLTRWASDIRALNAA